MLTVKTLASGSSGNAYIVATDQVGLVLDAGLSARRLLAHLDSCWIPRDRIGGVVVTHEHSDHCTGASALARQLDVPLYTTPGTARAMRLDPDEWLPLTPERALALGDLSVTPFRVVHDATDPVGLLIEHDGRRITLATDLGSVDDRTQRWIDESDLLILDTNHDLLRLWNGPYPASLKRRIASPVGHLSNEQAARCIVRAAERGRLKWAWLAHLSEENNTQRAALAAVRGRLRGGSVSVEVTRRTQPSLVWRSTAAYVQSRLF